MILLLLGLYALLKFNFSSIANQFVIFLPRLCLFKPVMVKAAQERNYFNLSGCTDIEQFFIGRISVFYLSHHTQIGLTKIMVEVQWSPAPLANLHSKFVTDTYCSLV